MPALSINQLKKVYTNGTQALRGVSFEVEEGDFFALLGPNGAGKSTLIGILTSLVVKTSGTVKILGYDIDHAFAKAKALIGIVPQEFNFNTHETLEKILLHQAGYYGIPPKIAKVRAQHYIKQLGLWKKRDVIARTLSGGMKRRLMIARALIHEPKVLILDEPTAGVDIEIRRSMWKFLTELNRKGVTIILTTHYLEEAEKLCRHVAIIDHGDIITHSPMSRILQQLDSEHFILDLREPCAVAPKINGFMVNQLDATTLEVEISKQQNLNEIFSALSQQGIAVISLRNKANRLEELFLKLTQNEN